MSGCVLEHILIQVLILSWNPSRNNLENRQMSNYKTRKIESIAKSLNHERTALINLLSQEMPKHRIYKLTKQEDYHTTRAIKKIAAAINELLDITGVIEWMKLD